MNQSIYDNYEPDLKAYLDNELPWLRRVQMRLHLSKCAHCAQELKTMQAISEELQTETTPPLEADLRAKILQSAPETQPEWVLPEPAPVPRRSYQKLTEGLVLTSLLLFMVCGVLSIMGNRVKNTFNSAANAITTDGGYDYSSSYSRDAASSAVAPPASAPSADNVLKELRTKMRDEVSITRRSVTPGSNGYGSGSYSDVVPQQRAVHKQGSLTVAVDDAEARGSEVEILVKNSGGFVANNALSTGGDGRKSATLDVRIPVASFESIVGKIGKLGTVREKSVSGEDITQKVTSAGVQRESLARELSIREAQLRALNKKKVSERQAAIADVRQLRYQAAEAKAQLEYLRKYAALSTLYVTLQDKQKVVAPASFTGSLKASGQEAWNSFLTTAKYPAQFLIWILAYSPLWIPALIIWKKWGRKLLSAS